MVDQTSKLEAVVATSPAGLVQFVSVEFGAALQHVRLVAVLELLLLWLAQLAPFPTPKSNHA